MFTREELYKKVWSTPTRKLKKSLGISDVAIAKLCKRLNIPKPPRGYWTKLQHGQKLPQTPLPVLDKDIPIRRVLFKSAYPRSAQEIGSETKAQNSAYAVPADAFSVPEDFRSAHPLVKKTRAAFGSEKPDRYGRIRPEESGCLDVNVGKGNVDRALLVMDALIKGLATKGYSVVVVKRPQAGGSGERSITQAIIEQQPVEFSLEEPSIQSERMATSDEKQRGYYDRWIYTLSGDLKFSIAEFSHRQIKRWVIRENRPIGEVLASLVSGMIEASKAIKARNIEFSRFEASRREDDQKRILQETRIRQLKENALIWDEVQKYRRFLDAIETAVVQKKGSVDPQSNIGSWLAWARSYLDSADPVRLFVTEENCVKRNPATAPTKSA